MDLSLLHALRQQSSQLASQRHEKSDEAYQEGLKALAQAQASGFRDKAALKQASQQFLKAIQMARGKAEPYVGLAYLLLLLGQQAQAVRYLQQAQRIEPEHEDTRKLLQYIQNPQAFAAPTPEPTPSQQGDSGFRILALERPEAPTAEASDDERPRVLREKLTMLSYEASKLPTALILDRKQLTLARQQVQEWEDQLEVIQEDIHDLERTQNVNSLLRSVQVLERRIEKLDKLCRDSAHLCQIHDDILDAQLDVRGALKQSHFVPEEADALEARLEEFLDECDRLADLIDESEAQGLETQALAMNYEALTAAVERFQDAVDDLK